MYKGYRKVILCETSVYCGRNGDQSTILEPHVYLYSRGMKLSATPRKWNWLTQIGMTNAHRLTLIVIYNRFYVHIYGSLIQMLPVHESLTICQH